MEQSGHILRRKGYKNKIAKGDRRWTAQNISEKDLEFMSYFYGYAIIGSTYKWIESGMQADFEHFIGKIAESIDATLPVMISKASKVG